MNALYDSRKIARAAGAKAVRRGTKIFGTLHRFLRHARAWGAKKSNGYFSLSKSSQHERGRLPGLIQPFVDQMRRAETPMLTPVGRPSRISTLGFTLFIAWVPPKSEKPSSSSYVVISNGYFSLTQSSQHERDRRPRPI